MASQTRMSAREEERRLNMRTLVIASAASATAAVVTSQLWVAGTWVAAALTPVIVALVSELLHRPTEVIAERVTSRNGAVLPQAAGAGAPPRRPETAVRAAVRTGPKSAAERAEPPVRIYRSGSRPGRGSAGAGDFPASPPRRRRVALGVVALTATLALAITAVAMTGTELVAGGSIGRGERDTTLFGGGRDEGSREAAPDGQNAPSRDEDGRGGGQPDAEPPPADEQPGQAEPPPDAEPPSEAPEAPGPAQP